MSSRKFSMEGALHLMSGGPGVLSPADLFHTIDDDKTREVFMGCNIYMVVCRRRMLIDPASVSIQQAALIGNLMVARDQWRPVPFRLALHDVLGRHTAGTIRAWATPTGTHLILDVDGNRMQIPSHVIVTKAECQLTPEERDLSILYVGQGIGRTRSRLAIDRLYNHSTLQRILADMHTHQPEAEVLLLLYRFGDSRVMISSAGDLNLTPSSTVEEDRSHLDRLLAAEVGRRARVCLAEAALINHFQPPYNTTFRGTDFTKARKLKLLREILSQDLTGLIVEIDSHTIRSRLRTEHCAPKEPDPALMDGYRRIASIPSELQHQVQAELQQILHTHIAHFPLTQAEERDSFLHGTCWHGESERQPLL